MSASSNRGRSTRSESTSKAIGRCSSSTLALKQVISLAVKASSIPPTESTDCAISSAVRRSVPFEHHVLDKMRDPVAFGRFAARSGAQPDAHRNRTHVRHLFRDDHQAVRKFRAFDIAYRLIHGCNCGTRSNENAMCLLGSRAGRNFNSESFLTRRIGKGLTTRTDASSTRPNTRRGTTPGHRSPQTAVGARTYGMVAEVSWEKALSTLLESTAVTT